MSEISSVVLQNTEGKFLRLYSVSTHIGNKQAYEWVDLPHATVVNSMRMSWMKRDPWYKKYIGPQVVHELKAKEVRTVELLK